MTRWLFPPEDTEWRKRRPHSAWRDFQFAFNQVQRTIEPAYPLAWMLAEWNAISEALADAPRLRLAKSQRISTLPKQVNAYAPPPPVDKRKQPPKRIRVGGNVAKARLVSQVSPQYPSLARQARIQGTVKLSVVISKDGSIQKLEVMSGHPLLVPSALAAVKQWRYKPTLLNGEAVEVLTNADVNFTLIE